MQGSPRVQAVEDDRPDQNGARDVPVAGVGSSLAKNSSRFIRFRGMAKMLGHKKAAARRGPREQGGRESEVLAKIAEFVPGQAIARTETRGFDLAVDPAKVDKVLS